MSSDLVISNWTQGVGPSLMTGFGDMRNLDIYTIPGVLRINSLTTKKSGSTVTALVYWMVRNPASVGQVFALDSAGQLYKSTDSGATWATVSGETSGGAGQGLILFRGYVIVARSTALDVYNISGDSWTNSWKTIDSDATWHPMFISKNDGKVYGGAGQYVFTIEELTTFDPSSAATYTFIQQALDLPANYRIKTISELGNNLMFGTWMGSNIYDFKVADIFPWNGSDPSFGLPLSLNEYGVNQMLNKDNILYILAGTEGKIYSSNGVQSTVVAQLPNSIFDLSSGKNLDFFPGGITTFKNRVYFGVGSNNAVSGSGVWSLNPTGQGNILTLEHLVSTGNEGTTNALQIGALLPITRDTMLISWRDNASYGIDLVDNAYRYTSYGALFESPMYRVGTNTQPRQFTELELCLNSPLTTGQGIRVKYRTARSASFTTIGTYDFATLGAIQSHNVEAGIPACEYVQIRCELTTGATSNTTPELISVTLR